MSARTRVALLVALTVAVLGAVTAYAVAARQDYRRTHDRPPSVATVAEDDAGSSDQVWSEPRIVFRHTGIDDHYGLVAAVPLGDPGGARAFTDVACDRVYATDATASCLRTDRGVVTSYQQVEYDADWQETSRADLPGIPSRTRLSPDGRLVSSTTFVTGHSYMQVGFSTATEIREVDGSSFGNLEKFALVVDGQQVRPRDRNVWGVTFADDRTFYATVGTGGRTYLVRGDLEARTLTSLRENAECPSLSPDGTHVAYKVDVGDGSTWWTPAVLDLATGRQTLLAGETRNVDDQMEWLDDDTLLYGVPRDDEPGVTDVWSLDTRADAAPQLLVEQAWSPAVVDR